jgi:phosphoglucosamine mutase
MLRFGTDGVRGVADTYLTSPSVVALGRAVARVVGAREFLIGRDTRESGPRIDADLTQGLTAEGVRVRSLGVASTPAIAFLAQRAGVPAAIVSASHNPWTDNGVKVVGADGRKLADELERAIEAELQAQLDPTIPQPASESRVSVDSATPGPVVELDAYVAHLLGALEGRTLEGLHIVVDCANGAASDLAPRAFRAAGAHVDVIHAEPDGRNINAGCGSTHPELLQEVLRTRGAQLGLALDGDADRVVAVDERGDLVDGDQIMVMTALDWHQRGILRNDAIAVTVMSNLGLRRALGAAGVGIVETPVGDRNVTAAMAEHDLAIGGEQSGHIVFADLATTGDGVLTGLIIGDLLTRQGSTMSAAAARMTRLPQVLVNVRLAPGVDLELPAVQEAARQVTAELGDRGRLVLRSSGTEPVVRVMVEAPTEAEAASAADRIQSALEQG